VEGVVESRLKNEQTFVGIPSMVVLMTVRKNSKKVQDTQNTDPKQTDMTEKEKEIEIEIQHRGRMKCFNEKI